MDTNIGFDMLLKWHEDFNAGAYIVNFYNSPALYLGSVVYRLLPLKSSSLYCITYTPASIYNVPAWYIHYTIYISKTKKNNLVEICRGRSYADTPEPALLNLDLPVGFVLAKILVGIILIHTVYEWMFWHQVRHGTDIELSGYPDVVLSLIPDNDKSRIYWMLYPDCKYLARYPTR